MVQFYSTHFNFLPRPLFGKLHLRVSSPRPRCCCSRRARSPRSRSRSGRRTQTRRPGRRSSSPLPALRSVRAPSCLARPARIRTLVSLQSCCTLGPVSALTQSRFLISARAKWCCSRRRSCLPGLIFQHLFYTFLFYRSKSVQNKTLTSFGAYIYVTKPLESWEYAGKYKKGVSLLRNLKTRKPAFPAEPASPDLQCYVQQFFAASSVILFLLYSVSTAFCSNCILSQLFSLFICFIPLKWQKWNK